MRPSSPRANSASGVPDLTLLCRLKNVFLSLCPSVASSPLYLLRSPVDHAGLARAGSMPNLRPAHICSYYWVVPLQILPYLIWTTHGAVEVGSPPCGRSKTAIT